MALDDQEIGRLVATVENMHESIIEVKNSLGKLFDRLDGLPCGDRLAKMEEIKGEQKKNDHQIKILFWLIGLLLAGVMTAGYQAFAK